LLSGFFGRAIDHHLQRHGDIVLAALDEHADLLAEQLQGLVGDIALVGVVAGGNALSIENLHGLHGALDVLDEALDDPLFRDNRLLSGSCLQLLDAFRDALICFEGRSIPAVRPDRADFGDDSGGGGPDYLFLLLSLVIRYAYIWVPALILLIFADGWWQTRKERLAKEKRDRHLARIYKAAYEDELRKRGFGRFTQPMNQSLNLKTRLALPG